MVPLYIYKVTQVPADTPLRVQVSHGVLRGLLPPVGTIELVDEFTAKAVPANIERTATTIVKDVNPEEIKNLGRHLTRAETLGKTRRPWRLIPLNTVKLYL